MLSLKLESDEAPTCARVRAEDDEDPNPLTLPFFPNTGVIFLAGIIMLAGIIAMLKTMFNISSFSNFQLSEYPLVRNLEGVLISCSNDVKESLQTRKKQRGEIIGITT